MEHEEIYVDQSSNYSEFYDRAVFSSYTPYGIKCIDSEFCSRIQNIDSRIVKIVYIAVERMLSKDSWLSKADIEKYKDLKSELTIEDLIENKWGGWGNELRITWENGNTREFFYWDAPMVIDIETGKENPVILREHILKNPHLHQEIKDNLISNLDSRV